MKATPDQYQDIRDAVRALCAQFPDEYHRRIDAEEAYPEEFVDALTKAGWLAALIPAEYGGSGLGLAEASVIMEEINRSGGNAGACHGQMYNMGTLLRHGSKAQKDLYLPRIASGQWRLQSMGVTEPTTGTDTTKIKTTAVLKGDRYVINGQKVWISRVQHSDWMILLARTTPIAEVKKKSEGMSIFMVDLRQAEKSGMTVRPIANMVNHETNELEVEAANLMRFRACELFDAHQPCGAEANMAKYLAAKASWEAGNACLQFHGGFGFAREYDVERKFRETRLYQVAPISTNLILSYVAEHLLGLPRSF